MLSQYHLLASRKLPNFLKQWFLTAGCYLSLSTTGFFTPSNVGTALRLSDFLPCPMDTFMSPESKWNSILIIYSEFIFPPSSPKYGYTLKPFLSSFWGLWEIKKTNASFNLGLAIHFVLRAFAVRHIAVIITTTAFSFFRSFPCFVWNFCCW